MHALTDPPRTDNGTMGTPHTHILLDALPQQILSRTVAPGQRLVELDVAA